MSNIFTRYRLAWILLTMVALGLVALIWPRAAHFLEVDKCLDAGGKWDTMADICISQIEGGSEQ